MIKLTEAMEIVFRKAGESIMGTEYVPVEKSLGRITSHEIQTLIDLPPFNRSAMDGYSLPEGDILDEYIVDGIIPAGEVWGEPVVEGHCVKVMTGAPVPDGASRVVMWEKTSVDGNKVRITDKGGKTNISEQGEDLKSGQILCGSGMLITPAVQAALVMGGVSEVPVCQTPKAAVFSTGNELISPGETIGPGKIYDSNGPMLQGLLVTHGIDTVVHGRIRDDLDESVKAIREGLKKADIVILTGAVSKGDFDFIPEALDRCGVEKWFDEVAIKPGKPITFGTKDGKMVIGLPGNPVSVFVGFHIFVLPAIYHRQGFKAVPRFYDCKLNTDVNLRKIKRDQLIPVIIEEDGGLRLVEYHGSAHLVALSEVDGFALIGWERNGLSAGDIVPFLPVMTRLYTK